MIEFILILIIILDLVSIILIINEELLYSPVEKILRIIVVLILPIIGASIVLYSLSKYIRKDKKTEDLNNDDYL